MKKAHTAELILLAGELPALIQKMELDMDAVAIRMAGLKDAGLVYASEHWRKDQEGEPRYFYLIYPQKQGEQRRREYVGCDQRKIEQARAGIARAKEYDELSGSLAKLSRYAQRASNSLQEARSFLCAEH
ncbi:MAG: hypothetical protein EOP12_03940 [Pseudomonas sp.]|jgi:hypothetical protein|nr:MAG: hypothetical protein EOP12_03940 [Pseudomonas sp.]